MRRGWMDWDAREVPRELLLQRVRLVAAECDRRGLQALLVYSGFPRSAQVSALSHFVPFWSQALLAVTRTGRSLLTMATTGRTVQWIHTTSVVDEVLVGPEIGAVAARWLVQQGLQGSAVAVAGLDDLPHATHAGLRQELDEIRLLDAADWYSELGAGFAPTAAVADRAQAIAQAALDSLTQAPWENAHAVVAALDAHCRREGAEEVAVYLAPDLQRDARLRRLEGDAPMGSGVAVQLTLAYKGHWLRIGGSFVHDRGRFTSHTHAAAAQVLLAQAAASGATLDAALSGLLTQLGGALEGGHLEGVRGGLPLATLCEVGTGMPPTAWPPGSSLTLVLRQPAGSRVLISYPKAAATAA